MEYSKAMSATELREKRLQDLLNSCQDQILQQVIGPFGLSPALFDDKDGGNVTTLHNFEKGVVATDEDKVRHSNWKMAKNGGYKRKPYDKNRTKSGQSANGENGTVTSAYTGNVLTAEDSPQSDHVFSVKAIETSSSAQLFMTEEERVKMANDPKNLVPSEGSINQSMQDKDKREWADSERKKDPGKTNAESFGVDRELLEQTVTTAEKHVDRTILVAQIKKQGTELVVTGAKEAGRNALRQALGLAMHTFISGTFHELKLILSKFDRDNLVDDIVKAMRRVLLKVRIKLKDILQAGISGLVQGFVSNLLTFMINNVITTAAKVVTMIREGIKGLWKAIKMMVSPPKGMKTIEVAREVSKILTAVVTTSIGLVFEESVKAFIVSVPVLAPIADILAPAITGILTGVVTALLIYSLDRFFDWLSSTGTEMLKAIESNIDETSNNINLMSQWLENQFSLSVGYQKISQGCLIIDAELEDANESQNHVIDSLQNQIGGLVTYNSELSEKLIDLKASEDEIHSFLNGLKNNI